MTLPQRGYCHQDNCRASVIWAPNERTGIIAPIDAITYPDGNVEVREDGTYRIIPKADREGRMLHKSHWATCSDPPNRRR